MKKILFPTDFSPTANNALDYAVAFANETNASITLIHVYSIPFNDATALPADYFTAFMEETKEKINQQLEDLTLKYPNGTIDKKHAIYGLFIATEIAEYAEKNNFDMIIMGTKGASNWLDKRMGSNTSHTMLRAVCPVLAIPEKAKYQGIKFVTFATDFDRKDGIAIAGLTEWTDCLTANLDFVHIDTKADPAKSKKVERFEHFPVPFSTLTVMKDASVLEGLDDYLEEQRTDILALYIPKRRLWERLFHTSVSKKLALHTRIPLMTFKDNAA